MSRDAFEVFEKREVDDSARTVKEIAEYLGLEHAQALKKVKQKLDSGELEQVWKRQSNRLVKAYRGK